MKIQLLIISLLFMTNGLCARGLDKAFQLLPQPQSVELLPGKGIMYTDLKFVSAASDTLVPILGALTDVLPRAGLWERDYSYNFPNRTCLIRPKDMFWR